MSKATRVAEAVAVQGDLEEDLRRLAENEDANLGCTEREFNRIINVYCLRNDYTS